jgi:hypothetical protein
MRRSRLDVEAGMVVIACCLAFCMFTKHWKLALPLPPYIIFTYEFPVKACAPSCERSHPTDTYSTRGTLNGTFGTLKPSTPPLTVSCSHTELAHHVCGSDTVDNHL